jgi:hypothetical protein
VILFVKKQIYDKYMYRIFGGSIIDETDISDMRQIDKSTVYIVSHLFSYMDILLTLEMITRSTISHRTIAGVANVPHTAKQLITKLFGYMSPKIKFVSYNTRDKNTSEMLADNLRRGDDLFLWQHPYNKHKSLYHLLSETRPRLVYIDIASHRANKTINNGNIASILNHTCCKTYTITSREINYSDILRANETDIVGGFNDPLWDLICRATTRHTCTQPQRQPGLD